MPTFQTNDVTLYYQEFGNPQNPTIVFTHSLLWDGLMFEKVIEQLSPHYHIINIDQHGHGQSSYRTPLTLESMAEDYYQMLVALKLTKVHWAGLSMGGMVGMRLALSQPDCLASLILMNTSANPERTELREMGTELMQGLKGGLVSELTDAILPFFFAPATFKQQPELIEQYRAKLLSYQDFEGIFQAALAVFSRTNISEQLAQLDLPSLVIVGREDVSTPVEESQHIAQCIPNAKLIIMEEVGHMSATEQPSTVAQAIEQFIRESSH